MDTKFYILKKTLTTLATHYQEYTSIEGFKWQVETLLDMTEAYKAIDMIAPEI